MATRSLLMEIAFSSAPTSRCVSLDYQRCLVWQQQRRIRKPSLPTIPSFMIVSKSNELQSYPRRSADYHPSIWDPKLIESFSTPYTHELYATGLQGLKQNVKSLLSSNKDRGILLKLIATIQRLGVAYHFEKEIEEVISQLHPDVSDNLCTTALQYRIGRERGLSISSEVFAKFRSRDGRFMKSLSRDMEGLLNLYEASFLGMPGEDILEDAQDFSMKNLKSLVENLESNLGKQVKQSLGIPLFWRMPRVEARNFIDIYENDITKNMYLLDLAKLDYNLVQYVYQQEVKELGRWWRNLGFKDELPFSRDRLIENYLWAMGIIFEPQFSKCRIGLTKFICILSAIDDMYDIYGSIDELECFTNAVDRWEMEAMEDLPHYMKICYLGMLNFANEVVFDVLKDHGLNTLPYIKEAWANLCRSYLVERRWSFRRYTPSMAEYLQNAWVSVGGPAAIVHAYVLLVCPISKDALDCIKHGSELIHWASLITRLSDDLGTSEAESKRGDVSKSIQCYMVEKGVSEEEAKDHIKRLIRYSWKKMNEESAKSSLPKPVVKMSLNMARAAQFIFQQGDGIGTSTGEIKDHVYSLIVKPIPFE